MISLLVGFVALSAFIAWRNSGDDVQDAPVAASVTLTPYSGDTLIVHLSEGNQERVVLGNSEIIVSVRGKSDGIIYRTPRATITATTPIDRNSAEMEVGDCPVVRPFTVTMHDVKSIGTVRATLVVAKLSSDANAATCKIMPIATPRTP